MPIKKTCSAALLGLSLGTSLLTSCHSAFVQATVLNESGESIPLFEVDYPSASFGSNSLAPGAHFTNRFKIVGNGPTKLIWTDSAQRDHTATGPELKEGEEGELAIHLRPGFAVTWVPRLSTP